MDKIKVDVDEAKEAWQEEAREEGFEMGDRERRQYVLQLIDQGLSSEEIKQRLLEK